MSGRNPAYINYQNGLEEIDIPMLMSANLILKMQRYRISSDGSCSKLTISLMKLMMASNQDRSVHKPWSEIKKIRDFVYEDQFPIPIFDPQMNDC